MSASALAKAFWSFFSKKDILLAMSHGQVPLALGNGLGFAYNAGAGSMSD
jgi:hypothetical protein